MIRLARRMRFLGACALCVACGGGENGGTENAAGEGGEAGDDGTSGSSGSPQGGNAGTASGGTSGGSGAATGGAATGGSGAAGESMGGEGGDSGSAGSSGSSGSGGGGELPLVPLVAGHRATFRFVALDSSMPMLETCTDPFTEVGEMATIQSVTGVRYLSFCTDTEVLLEGSGDSLTAYPINPNTGTMLGQASEYIHSPVEEGESWESGATTYTWAEQMQPVTVPAGAFDDCWERAAPPDVTSFVYCRGVGLVSGVSMVGNWRIELVSKNY